jgi:hypothetical protein
MNTFFKRSLIAAAGVAALLNTHSASAQALLQVTVNTSPLITDSSDAPLWLDFLWTNDSSTSDVNNIVTLSNFNLGGGSVTEGTSYMSGANVTGDLSSTVQIGDEINGSGNFSNEFAEQFTPGSTLSFDISIPRTGQPGVNGTESLAFSILAGAGDTDFTDADSNPLYTTAPDGGSLVDVSVPAVDSPTGTFTYTAYQSTSPSPLNVVATVVPEPDTYACIGLGMVAMLALGRKVRRARA